MENLHHHIQFNDVDKHVDENNVENTVEAPKDINTLEEKQRMNSMNNYDDDDDDDEDDYEPLPKIKIHTDNNMPLKEMDVHDVSKKLSIEPDVILNDIEILG
ncbi:MAG: hypothetical protein CXT73_06475 [Methanobacteriota archaeon]|nr:MAG: hypothetical protein CXT73_06475 [Euryarchaeota archaeon]